MDRPLHLMVLSARCPEALRDIVRRYESNLPDTPSIADACFTANAGRTHFKHRMAVVGATALELRHGLAAYLAGESNGAVATSPIAGSARPRVAFLFTGQGSQYAGMGRLLYETSPVFRGALDECAAGLGPHMERGLLEVMFAPEDSTPIHDTVYAQPATFAIEYALATLWRSFGVEPEAVLGHSLGEYAAACAAGVLPLEDALHLVAARGSLTHRLSEDGAMGAVFASEEVVAAEVARSEGALAIAAYNGPEHLVISGARSTVAAALTRLEASGVRVKPLRVAYAAHSQFVEPILPAFKKVLETVRFERPSYCAGVECDWRARRARRHRSLQLLAHPHARAGSFRVVDADARRPGHHAFHRGRAAPGPAGHRCRMRSDGRRSSGCPRCAVTGRTGPTCSKAFSGSMSMGPMSTGTASIEGITRRRIALPTYPFRKIRHWMNVVGAARGTSQSVPRIAGRASHRRCSVMRTRVHST